MISSKDSLTNAVSQLPLVPYFPGEFQRMAEYGSPADNIVDGIVRQMPDQEGIPLVVVKDVLHENYRRRAQEAQETVSASALVGLTQGASDMSQVSSYISFRQIDTDTSASLNDRAKLFLEHPLGVQMQAYEIYARPKLKTERAEDGDIFDPTFARDCLEAVAAHRAPVLAEAYSLPKLTRIIETDPKKRRFGVVTTKICVGGFYDDAGSPVTLKSRQAGVVDMQPLSGGDNASLEQLWRYNRRQGRTPELEAARQELREILRANKAYVQPIVESLYLTRQ